MPDELVRGSLLDTRITMLLQCHCDAVPYLVAALLLQAPQVDLGRLYVFFSFYLMTVTSNVVNRYRRWRLPLTVGGRNPCRPCALYVGAKIGDIVIMLLRMVKIEVVAPPLVTLKACLHHLTSKHHEILHHRDYLGNID
jgi:hypothetical protein